MELSELTDQLRSKGIKVEVVPSLKTYYNVFPHVVRFTNNGNKFEVVRPIQIKIQDNLRKVTSGEYKIRRDYYDLNVYCMDPVKLLEAINVSNLKKLKVVIEHMEEKVLDQAMIKPDLPRAVTRVVRKLPWGYRYRVHWPRNWRIMQEGIGREAFVSIIDHINNDPNSKSFGLRTTQDLLNFRYWGANYFYTNNEDILCIISLINARFIQKIEKFITIEEIDEQAASRNTD